MPKFRFQPGEVEAVQFTGSNWIELANFCGTRKDGDGHEMPVFNPIGTFLLPFFNPTFPNAKGELWSEGAKKLFPVMVGDWIVKGEVIRTGEGGFHVMKDDFFQKIYDPIED